MDLQTPPKKERIVYLDILKSIAIFVIIFSHVCIISSDVEVLTIPMHYFGHVGKLGVAIFLMITGALVLDRTYKSNHVFLKKKLTRIFLPYLLWIIVTIIVIGTVNNIPFDLNAVRFYIVDVFFNLGVNWYFWMMIGVYFAIPIINEYIKNKGEEGAKYFMMIACGSSIVYTIIICLDTITYIDLVFFLGPITYLFLGFYLYKKEFKMSNAKLLVLGIILFCTPFALRLISYPSTTYYFIFMNIDALKLITNLDVSIFGILECSGLFLMFKAIDNHNIEGIMQKIKKFFYIPHVKSFNLSVSKASYGMYLAHMFLIMILYAILPRLYLSGFKTFVFLILITVLIFLIAWICVLAVSKIPYLKKFSGYA